MDETSGATACSPLLSLCENVLVESEPDRVIVVSSWGDTTIDHPPQVVRALLERMVLGPVSLENALHVRGAPVGPGQRAQIDRTLDRLSGSVEHSLALPVGGPVLVSAVPVSSAAPFARATVGPRDRLRLSRFATIRPSGGRLLAESPLARHRVVLHSPAVAALLAAFAVPTRTGDLDPRTFPFGPRIAEDVAGMLVAARVLAVDDGDGGVPSFAEDTDAELAAWPPAELAFLRWTRDAHDGRPPPATVPPRRRPRTGGPGGPGGPDGTDDPAGSVRVPDAAWVRQWLSGTGDLPLPPELGLYLLVGDCPGLPRGAHRLDPASHTLVAVDGGSIDGAADGVLGAALDAVARAASTPSRPPLVLVATHRPVRRLRRGRGAGLASALCGAGGLLCVLRDAVLDDGVPAVLAPAGGGELLDRALGLDGLSETSVAELTVG